MTLASQSANPNHASGERSVAPADQHVNYGQDERPAENVWSTIRHHTSSWSLLWRLLVLVLGLSTFSGAAIALMWLLGMRINIAGIEIAPAA